MKRAWPPGVVVLGLAAVLGAGLSACGSAPKERPSAEAAAPPAKAERDSYGRVRLPVGARVLVLGDALVGPPAALPGAKLKTKARNPGAPPYTAALAAALGPRVSLTLATRPGETLDQAIAAFPTYPHADAVVMLFGPGDLWAGSSPLPANEFSRKLRTLIGLAKAAGSLVVLVPPPPAETPALNAPLQAYRGAVQAQGHLADASVVDLPPNLGEVRHLWSDGVHLDTPGSRAIGRLVAAQFVPPR